MTLRTASGAACERHDTDRLTPRGVRRLPTHLRGRAVRALRPLRPSDAAALATAVADFYPACASAGKPLCQRLVPACLALFPATMHTSSDLARLLWAVSVVSEGGGVAGIGATLRAACVRIDDDVNAMHPKFAMLALKGCGGLVRRHTAAGGPLLASEPSFGGAATALRCDDAPDLPAVVQRLALHALGRIGDAASAMRVEGLAEAAAAGADLVACEQSASVETVFGAALRSMRAHAGSGAVPLRALTRLLAAAAFLHASGAGGGGAPLQAQVATLHKAARRRLQHSKHGPTPYQVRGFVQALRWVAPVAGVANAGLVRAALIATASPRAVAVAKAKGAAGAERLVRSLELLAELEAYGVAYGKREASSGNAGSVTAGVRVQVDAGLQRTLQGLVHQARAGDALHASNASKADEHEDSVWGGGASAGTSGGGAEGWTQRAWSGGRAGRLDEAVKCLLSGTAASETKQ
jgi:hypothetical protein